MLVANWSFCVNKLIDYWLNCHQQEHIVSPCDTLFFVVEVGLSFCRSEVILSPFHTGNYFVTKFRNLCKLVPFCKKISSVNSQFSKELNFKILFCNLEHVLFCEILRKICTYGHGALWLVNRPVFTNVEWSVDDVVPMWFSKVYLQCDRGLRHISQDFIAPDTSC